MATDTPPATREDGFAALDRSYRTLEDAIGVGEWYGATQEHAAQQCVSERRLQDYSDLVSFARNNSSLPGSAPPAPATATKPAGKKLPSGLHQRMASLVVKQPSPGETFYERMAKYVNDHLIPSRNAEC